jgi:hypothetical protein
MSPAKDCQIRNLKTLRTTLTALIAAALLAFGAGPAMAQTDDPTDAQYNPPADIIDSGVAGVSDQDPTGAVGGVTDSGTGTGTGAGSLPFTGLDVALASVVAALLIGTGLLMRRAAREQGTA